MGSYGLLPRAFDLVDLASFWRVLETYRSFDILRAIYTPKKLTQVGCEISARDLLYFILWPSYCWAAIHHLVQCLSRFSLFWLPVFVTLLTMGVACLFNWPLPPGKSPTQAAEMLHKRIQALGAKESGTFAVDCETYQTQVADEETCTLNSRI